VIRWILGGLLLGSPVAVSVATLSSLSCNSSTDSGGGCGTGDQDGISGGTYAFDLTVTDDAFAPIILKTQNNATVTLTLTNAGTKPHDFAIDCLPTPNDNGCPATSCFPDASAIGPVPPDASASTTFVTPNPEGIYTFRSNLPGDTQTGQFVVQ
jgi:hypothetical protein